MPMDLNDKVTVEEGLNSSGQMEYTCPLSKDNYYFAVRAISSGNHPGLPAVAR